MDPVVQESSLWCKNGLYSKRQHRINTDTKGRFLFLFPETLGGRDTSVTLDGAWTVWEDTYGKHRTCNWGFIAFPEAADSIPSRMGPVVKESPL